MFQTYHPQIVIHAAAHKHVPLMEHNCVEAVKNNVFGTKNVMDTCEKFGAERMMMVSTDKAVNPTNVMGATKRMCELMVLSASTHGRVRYSATRFGNVLGSAGSVIPLFKKQIASGGPVTITDKRIIRYFMTIPEASQLVLASGAMAKNGELFVLDMGQPVRILDLAENMIRLSRYFMTIPEASQLVLASGAMAKNGELFVLDMGQPVRILDLAENMIRLSGVHGIEIVETGLRPGEKLYEELLVQTEELDKTDNSLIFVERDTPLDADEVNARLDILAKACLTEDDAQVRQALRQAVPTYRRPEDVNCNAEESAEMKNQRELAMA